MLRLLLAAFLVCSSFAAAAAQDAPLSLVRKVEARFHGIHSVYIDEQIPDEGCDFTDRMVVDTVGDPGGLVMVNIANDALLFNKRVISRVDGCAPFNRTGSTAPRAVRIEIRR